MMRECCTRLYNRWQDADDLMQASGAIEDIILCHRYFGIFRTHVLIHTQQEELQAVQDQKQYDKMAYVRSFRKGKDPYANATAR